MSIYTKNLIYRKCILCNKDEFRLISKMMRRGPKLNTVICTTCSLVQTNPVPTEELYYSFYQHKYEQFYGKSTAAIHAIDNVPPILDELSKHIDISKSSYIEIGPGRGKVLWHAAKVFQSAMGVEPSFEFANHLNTVLSIPTQNTTLEKFVSLDKNKYDVVAMFHVLEHFYNPDFSLKLIHKMLNKNGLIVIEVPNILKPFRDLDRYFLRFVHLFNFSPLTLSLLLKKNNFEIQYLNESGDDWKSPQNIIVIARKMDSEFENISLPLPSQADFVIDTLNQYRETFKKKYQKKWLWADLRKKTRKKLRWVKHTIQKVFHTYS